MIMEGEWGVGGYWKSFVQFSSSRSTPAGQRSASGGGGGGGLVSQGEAEGERFQTQPRNGVK